MLRRDFAKALIAAGVGVAAPSIAGEGEAPLVLDDVQRLTVKPGDVITLSVDGHMSIEIAERLKARMRDVFPDNKVIVLSDGLKLGVVGPDA